MTPVDPYTRRKRNIILLGVAAAVVAVATLAAGHTPPAVPETPAVRDQVTIESCAATSATVAVRNNHTYPASYDVTIAFESADGSSQYGTGVATLRDVAPGQTGHGEALSTGGGPVGTCRIVRAQRW